MFLRFEVGSLKGQDLGEACGLRYFREYRISPEDLGKAIGWEGVLG